MFLGFFQQIGVFEIVVLCFLGLLIFGRRLPEVGKNLGRSIVEFKKGLNNVDEEVRQASQAPPPVVKSSEPARLEDKSAPSTTTANTASSSTTQHHT